MAVSKSSLSGFAELHLLDSSSGKVIDVVKSHNQVTSIFLRWILYGNIGIPQNLCKSFYDSYGFSDFYLDKNWNVKSSGEYSPNMISRLLESFPFVFKGDDGDLNVKSGDEFIFWYTDGTVQKNVETAITCLSNGMQVIYSSLGSDSSCFNVYMLSDHININPFTIIPPYFSGDCSTLSDNVVFYGNDKTIDCNKINLEINSSDCYFTNDVDYIKNNGDAGFTGVLYSYLKRYGHGNVKSVVIGAHPRNINKTIDSYILIRQSPSYMRKGWDNSLEKQWNSVDNIPNGGSDYKIFAGAVNPPELSDVYLIDAFSRTSKYKSNHCDCLYAPNSEGNVCYYDFGSYRFLDQSSNETGSDSFENTWTDERVTWKKQTIGSGSDATERSMFTSDYISGGYSAYSKAFRVNNGIAKLDSFGNCIGRTFTIYFQNKLSGASDSDQTSNGISGLTGTSDSNYGVYESDVYYSSKTMDGTNAIIPPTVYLHSAPVMVAVRGENQDDDIVEIFISMGVGSFDEYSEKIDGNVVYHPGGNGIEVHKIVFKVGKYSRHDSYFSSDLNTYDDVFVNYGRVAVLPFAVGVYSGYPELNSNKTQNLSYLLDIVSKYDKDYVDDNLKEVVDNLNKIVSNYQKPRITGKHYVVGSYYSDCYYLPITHKFGGFVEWDYNKMEIDDNDSAYHLVDANVHENYKLNLCSGSCLHIGAQLFKDGLFFIKEIPFGLNDIRLSYLRTRDGFGPISVNQSQRWFTIFSFLISGVNFDNDGVYKKEDETLKLFYKYGFKIRD